jgi:hypothetical protein
VVISKLKAWKETTTMSPSGVHLGHYKALIERHKYSHVQDNKDELSLGDNVKMTELRDELNYMQESLRKLHLQQINYALERGYVYQRWQKVVNTILFKEQNNIKIITWCLESNSKQLCIKQIAKPIARRSI